MSNVELLVTFVLTLKGTGVPNVVTLLGIAIAHQMVVGAGDNIIVPTD
jgi:hypothetical protein